MATDASQLSFDAMTQAQSGPVQIKRARTFAGLTPPQMIVGLLVLVASIWAMWTTREVMQLRAHKVVSVRLGELVNQFALAEARSGDDPDKVTARTRGFMEALDKALKARSADGAVVLVGEAIVASSGEDITAAVAADVAKLVPMPIAQAMPARLPVVVGAGSGGGAGGAASSGDGVGQAMLSAFGPAGTPSSAPAGGGDQGSAAGYSQGGPGQQGTVDPSAYQGGGNGQP